MRTWLIGLLLGLAIALLLGCGFNSSSFISIPLPSSVRVTPVAKLVSRPESAAKSDVEFLASEYDPYRNSLVFVGALMDESYRYPFILSLDLSSYAVNWAKVLDSYPGFISSVTITKDAYYLALTTLEGEKSYDSVLSLNPTDGAVNWGKRFLAFDDVIGSVVIWGDVNIAPDGSVVAIFKNSYTDSYEMKVLLAKLRADGSVVWAKASSDTYLFSMATLALNSRGDIFAILADNVLLFSSNGELVKGYSFPSLSMYSTTVIGDNFFALANDSNDNKAFILKFDSDGNFVWSKEVKISGATTGVFSFHPIEDTVFLAVLDLDTSPVQWYVVPLDLEFNPKRPAKNLGSYMRRVRVNSISDYLLLSFTEYGDDIYKGGFMILSPTLEPPSECISFSDADVSVVPVDISFDVVAPTYSDVSPEPVPWTLSDVTDFRIEEYCSRRGCGRHSSRKPFIPQAPDSISEFSPRRN